MLTRERDKQINYVCNGLKRSLDRCEPSLPKGLRRMAIAMLREALKRGAMGEPTIHPGNKKLRDWANVSERTARSNLRKLERWGFIEPVAHTQGGGYATRFIVHPMALSRVAQAQRGNPCPKLLNKLRTLTEAQPTAASAAQDPGNYPGNLPRQQGGQNCPRYIIETTGAVEEFGFGGELRGEDDCSSGAHSLDALRAHHAKLEAKAVDLADENGTAWTPEAIEARWDADTALVPILQHTPKGYDWRPYRPKQKGPLS